MPDKPHPLRVSSDGKARVVAWESRRGQVYTLVRTGGDRQYGKLVTRNPSDKQIESARRVVVEYEGRYYTADRINRRNYTLDDVISGIESDAYKELRARQQS